MKVGKVKRLANPRRSAKKNARKKLSDKQIKHFGTKAQRAALKRRRSVARSSKPNPAKVRTRTKVVYRTRTVKAKTTKRRRKSNPLQMVTLGLINPRKGKGMTKTKRRTKKASTARRQNRRKNSTRIVVMGRKPNGHRRKSHRSSRNPSIAGVSGAKNVGELLIGGVGGVILGSVAPGFFPAAMTSNPVFSAIGVGVIGWIAGMAVNKMNKNIGDGVMFGSWLSATQQIVNNFVPGLPGLTGMGAFYPAQFNVPDNPVWQGQQNLLAARQAAAATAAAATPSTSLKGVMSAYGGAY